MNRFTNKGLNSSASFALQWIGHVRIHGKVRGLKRGLHGLHIHAVGDVSFNCNNAGTHFNPEGVC